MGNTYDYIIVGAGSAGCVLANRLSADPGIRVLLIEAGGSDNHLIIQMPAACAIAARDSRFDWGYVSEPEANCDGRTILEHRGRVLGGSSSTNGMVANRGNPHDYDGWATEGLPTCLLPTAYPISGKWKPMEKERTTGVAATARSP